MKPTTRLILGGTRSGKTRCALALAERQPHRTYIATAQAWDDEMRERIQTHKRERDETWATIEEPIAIANAIRKADAPGNAIVIDCLTLWLSNLMSSNRNIDAETENLISALHAPKGVIICVTNEVGLGIVPENALARRFRDAQGRLNHAVAAAADSVDFIAAGIVLNMKPGSGG